MSLQLVTFAADSMSYGSNVTDVKGCTARQALCHVMAQKCQAKIHVSGPIAQLQPELLLWR